MTKTKQGEWKFVTESPSYFVWRKDLGNGISLFKNLNKHTGKIILRRLWYDH